MLQQTPKTWNRASRKKESIEKWQQQWDHTSIGSAPKEFFPNIKDRLKTKINLTSNFTAMIAAHGKTKSYLYRFKIIDSPRNAPA